MKDGSKKSAIGPLLVKRNTYPRWDNIGRAEPGDIVHWTVIKRNAVLVRDMDDVVVFSRDPLPNDQDDYRPMVGIIASVKCKGWYLEVSPQNS